MAEQPETDIEQIINDTVNDIWNEFDTDRSGSLDKAETRRFVNQCMGSMNRSGIGQDGGVSDEEFETIFAQFDKDGSGFIERDEMAIVVRKLSGL